MDFSDLIALKIKELMDNQHITIYKLESLSGVYSSTIALFLTRKTKTIRLENLLFICEALGISLSDLLMQKLMIGEITNKIKIKFKKNCIINFFLNFIFYFLKHNF